LAEGMTNVLQTISRCSLVMECCTIWHSAGLVWPSTDEGITTFFMFWGCPVGWTPILETLAHFQNTQPWWVPEQEPNEKMCPIHTPSIHPRWCVCGYWFTLALLEQAPLPIL
jgi:hypothetical protein